MLEVTDSTVELGFHSLGIGGIMMGVLELGLVRVLDGSNSVMNCLCVD